MTPVPQYLIDALASLTPSAPPALAASIRTVIECNRSLLPSPSVPTAPAYSPPHPNHLLVDLDAATQAIGEGRARLQASQLLPIEFYRGMKDLIAKFESDPQVASLLAATAAYWSAIEQAGLALKNIKFRPPEELGYTVDYARVSP